MLLGIVGVMAKSRRWLSVLVLLVISACGGESETDEACEKARQMYQEMKERAKNPDLDGDGTVSVSEQVTFEALKENRSNDLYDFREGWYDVGGCDLD